MKNVIADRLESVEFLRGWKSLNTLPDVEEKPEDIWLLIEYDDHGDDFLVVGTRDGKLYQYALYTNRKFSEFNHYVREPKLYKKLDDRAHVSNDIFFKFERLFQKSHMSFGYDLKLNDATEAQCRFMEAIHYISNLRETTDTIFDYDIRKDDIRFWLELNGIDTEENLKILSETKFHNKEGDHKVIGVAGKMDITGHEWLGGDGFQFVCVNNKEINPEKVVVLNGYDEWGVERYSIPIKSFRPSKK